MSPRPGFAREYQTNSYCSRSLSVLFASPGGKTPQFALVVTCSASSAPKKELLHAHENVRPVHEHLLPLTSFLSTWGSRASP